MKTRLVLIAYGLFFVLAFSILRSAANRQEESDATAVPFAERDELKVALSACAKKLAGERKAYGDVHEDVAASLRRMAELHAYQGEARKARQEACEALDIQGKLHDGEPWQVADARRMLNLVDAIAGMAPSQRLLLAEANKLADQVLDLFLKDKFRDAIKLAERIEQIYAQAPAIGPVEHATSLNNLGVLHQGSGNYGRAEPLYRRALKIFKPTLGEEHPDYVTAFNNLAVLQGLKGDYAAALPLYRRALELRGKAVGEKHPDYVRSLNNLAWLYKAMGDYAGAEPLYLKALKLHQHGLSYGRPNARILEIYRQVDLRNPPVAGKMQTDLALIVGNLAVLYHEKGDYARAEPWYRQALDIYKKTVGENHSLYARNVNNLAAMYQLMGDDVRAEDLFRKAVALRKQALGDKHLDYATTLHNLGRFYHVVGDFDRAEPLYLQALAIRKEALGDKHPYYGQTLDKLAWLHHAKGDYERAEPRYAEALEVRTRAFGDKHRYDATIVTNQALLYQAMGNHQKAETLFRKSLEWTKNQVGDQNAEYARTLHHLGMLHFATKKDDGESLARDALDISRKLLEQCASIQSERQQLAMMQTTRFYLDGYLSMTAAAKAPAERVYAEVLAWKGAVTIRQQSMRRLRQTLEKEGKKDALKLYHDLEQATRKLAALSQSQSTGKQPANPRQELERLSGAIERLEQALAAVSEEFRRGRDPQRRSPADIAHALPIDAILIDLLEYNRSTAPESGQGEFQSQRALTAFVVRKDRPVQRIDLGPVLPIAAAVDGLRQALVRKSQDRDMGQSLRRLLWEPLARHVDGAKVVLISPDGAVARFPWSVLPGQKPGSYLLEEYAIAIVPVPAQMPELMARPKDAGGTPALLLVGDVNFDGAPGAAKDLAFARSAPHTTRSGAVLSWGQLAGTQAEVAAIKSTFQKRFAKGSITDLRQDRATEEGVRMHAPQHRYLHFATHGFFAAPGRADPPISRGNKPSTRAARIGADMAGFHPGLLSGLVLAGANLPVQPERDDGILTALEVSELDLAAVELAVLSACETGLGETTGGEGLLGLQRAFQMAGARSVVAGLWKVPDRGTQALMQRFYDNLWRHNMGKLDALREAQLWLLREGDTVPGVVRGLGFEDAPPVKDGRLPPFYWGAFALSGDWR